MSWIVQICCVFTCFTIHVPCTRTSGYFRECSCLEIHVLEHHDYLPFIMSQIHAYFADLLYFDWHFTSKWMTHTWSQAERITRANQRLMRTSRLTFWLIFSSCTYIHDSVPNLEVIHIRCLEDWRNSWLLEWVYRHVLAKLPVT